MERPPIYKLVARSIRRPSVWNETALPVGYFDHHFNGRPLPARWEPPAHYLRGLSYRLPDCVAWQLGRPLVSERAAALLECVAPGCVEYRHFLDIKGKPYFVMNVLASEDVLDEGASEITRTNSGQIVSVIRYCFGRSPAAPIFKLPGRFDSDTFCTESVPEAVVRNNLTGFGFWDPFNPTLRRLFNGEDLNCYPGVAA